jgi:hypothetical protein
VYVRASRRQKPDTRIDPEASLKASELEQLTAYFRRTFGNASLAVKARPKLSDSAELYLGEEFLGIISRIEDEGEVSYDLSMSILDIDLEE